MSLQFPHALESFKILSCFLIAVGLGWVFAEVRRFFFEPEAFCREAVDDDQDGRVISLVCGVTFLLVGFGLAFAVFDWGSVNLSLQFPYVAGGADGPRFFAIFCSGLAAWAVLSAISTRFLPPPLLGESTTMLLSRVVRGGLLILWSLMVFCATRQIGDHWMPDCLGLLLAAISLAEIVTGSLGHQYLFGTWPVPPITFEDRPFPYVASVLVCTGLAYFCFLA